MKAIREAVFDKIAPQYDAVWSDTPVGKAQRVGVWCRIDALFKEGDFVLDLGCGTGVDALHLRSRGVSVYGIDSSPRMVEVARSRGVEAHCCPIEHLQSLELRLDGAMSNFGALNCVTSLASVAVALSRMVRSGGYLALCFISPLCLWEMAFYLWHAKAHKAFRRLRGRAGSAIGASVFYPSSAAIVSAFQNDFRLLTFYGIGVSVPPSYVTGMSASVVERLSVLDQWLAHKPVLRSLADHRLYVFERI
jgi:ubiquinone/menaquinone biosynthesis C-methylase UbiE